MFKDAFSFARLMGMKVGMGGELGQVNTGVILNSMGAAQIGVYQHHAIPPAPEVEKWYEGIFTRLSRAHPVDFYTVFTPEHDYWLTGPFDLNKFNVRMAEWKSILAVWDRMQPPFELVAGGWTLGPAFDRAAFDKTLPKHVTLSEFSRAYNGPVEPALARIEGRGKWEIAWCEEDTPFLAPQLWVGRVRKDAADSLAYGCNGLLGLYWRNFQSAPATDALARACWNQRGWNPEAGQARPKVPRSTFYIEGPYSQKNNRWVYGYDPHATPVADVAKPINGTDEPDLYRTLRYELLGYRVKVPDGQYEVTLKFAEPVCTEPGQRVFDIVLQGQTVQEQFDVFAHAGALLKACDITTHKMQVIGHTLVWHGQTPAWVFKGPAARRPRASCCSSGCRRTLRKWLAGIAASSRAGMWSTRRWPTAGLTCCAIRRGASSLARTSW